MDNQTIPMQTGIIFLIMFFSLNVAFHEPSFGQQENTSGKPVLNYVPRTPEASMVTQYGGGFNVSSKGLAEIEIPLYVVKAGNLSIPITINYISDGIRLNEADLSPVGLKWVLNAGGMVSRNVVGIPDEDNRWNSGWIRRPTENLTQFVCNNPIKYQPYYDREVDFAPDKFYYSFLGNNGNFFLHPNAPNNLNVIQTQNSPLTITREKDNKYFDIIDGNGNNYRFSAQETFSSFSSSEGHSSHTDETTVGWKISQMQCLTGESAVFEYSVYDPVEFSSSSYQVKQLPSEGSYPKTIQTISTETYKKVLLSRISSPTQDLYFTYDGFRLVKIEVKNKMGNVVKVIKLSYCTNKQQLLGVSVHDPLESQAITYSFEYNQGTIPPFGSHKQDIFGYHNWNSQTLMIPGPSGAPFARANREIHSDRLVIGTLKKVIYPTGGYTTYEYEPNIETINGTTKYGPGLRVRQITDYNSDNSIANTRTYQYSGLTAFPFEHTPNKYDYHYYVFNGFSDAVTGLGIIESDGSYEGLPIAVNRYEKTWSSTLIPEKIDNVLFNFPVVNYWAILQDIYSPIVTRDIQFVQYNNIRIDSQGGGSVNLNYEYRYNGVSLDPFLRKTSFIDNDNNPNKEVVHSDSISYIELFQYNFMSRKPYFSDGWSCESSGVGFSGGLMYYPPFSRRMQYAVVYHNRTSIETVFTPNGDDESDLTPKDGVETRTHTSFNNYNLANRVTVYEKQGNTYKTKQEKVYRYAADGYSPNIEGIPGISPPPSNVVLPIATLLEENSYDTENFGSGLVQSSVYRYNAEGLPIAIYALNATMPISVQHTRKYDNSLQYTYHPNNKVKEIITPAQTTSLHWGYNNSLVVAKFDNINYAVVESNANGIKTELDKLQNYTTMDTPAKRSALKTLNGSIRNKTPEGAQVTTYTHDPLVGVTSQTDPNGITTFYEYDGLGRLSVVRDHDENILKKYDYNYAE